MGKDWYVYIVECRTKELYVGTSNNVQARIKKHNQGRACRYTKYRNPVKLLYVERCGEFGQARRREIEIKKFPRGKKLKLIASIFAKAKIDLARPGSSSIAGRGGTK